MKAHLCSFYQVRYPKNRQKVSTYDGRSKVQPYKVCAQFAHKSKSNDQYIYFKRMSPSGNMVLIYMHMSIG